MSLIIDLQEYQGWKNHGTWLFHIWMYQDDYCRQQVEKLTIEAFEENDADGDRALQLQKSLEAFFEEIRPEPVPTFWGDLLEYAIAQIDWWDLGKTYIKCHRIDRAAAGLTDDGSDAA